MHSRRWAAALLAGAAITSFPLIAPPADAGTPPHQDAAATRAVLALTASDGVPDGPSVPRDFAERLGYLPRVSGGMLVNPHGACSSPVPLPTEFDIPCKAHDLGYDLLRYAHAGGGDLGPWARSALDAQLDRRMREACDARVAGRASCFALANTATTAVAVNSRRQGYGVPIDEPWLRAAVVTTLSAVGLLATAAATRRLRRAVVV